MDAAATFFFFFTGFDILQYCDAESISSVTRDHLRWRESRQLCVIAQSSARTAASWRWATSRGERKTFRLTLSLFVLMCGESPSINNKNSCLRASPRGLISSTDPRPCHWDGFLRLEPVARGQWLFVLRRVCPGFSHNNHTRRHPGTHLTHASAPRARVQIDVHLDTHLYLNGEEVCAGSSRSEQPNSRMHIVFKSFFIKEELKGNLCVFQTGLYFLVCFCV